MKTKAYFRDILRIKTKCTRTVYLLSTCHDIVNRKIGNWWQTFPIWGHCVHALSWSGCWRWASSRIKYERQLISDLNRRLNRKRIEPTVLAPTACGVCLAIVARDQLTYSQTKSSGLYFELNESNLKKKNHNTCCIWALKKKSWCIAKHTATNGHIVILK